MKLSMCARSALVFAACGALVAVAAESACAHGDVWLYTDVANDKLALGEADEAGVSFTPGVRVYEAILAPDTLPFSAFDSSAEDPGFRAAPGDLPPSQSIGLTIESLSLWNGSGLVPAAGVSFGFGLSGGFASLADGSLHEHALYGLADLTADAQPIPDGVYVATFRASMPGLGDSDLAYFVMLHDALITDETDAETVAELLEEYENGGPAPVFGGKDFSFFEEAHEFVAGTVPEPSGVLLAGCAGIAMALFRRRK